jgi:MtN3 and saliva related transmembrane protein
LDVTADLLGFLAGICTTMAFVPQAIKAWRTRSAKDLSLWMYVVFLSGVVLWFAYGVMIGAWPVILANAITFGLALSILIVKLRHG